MYIYFELISVLPIQNFLNYFAFFDELLFDCPSKGFFSMFLNSFKVAAMNTKKATAISEVKIITSNCSIYLFVLELMKFNNPKIVGGHNPRKIALSILFSMR
jgi:hypothetical protein